MRLPLPAVAPTAREELIRFIVGLFRGPLLSPAGVPVSFAGGDVKDDLLPELADYAPLLAAAGEREWALAQGELAFKLLTDRPLLSGLRTRARHPGPLARLLRALHATHVQDYAEILLGFVELHQITGDGRPLSHARWLVDFLYRQFGTRHGLASFWTSARLPVYEPLSGTLIEATLDYARIAGDDAARDRALRALDPLLENPVFKEAGLVPSFVLPSPSSRPLPLAPTRRIDLAKANTAFGSALVAAYRDTGEPRYADALRRLLCDGLGALRAPDGGFSNLGRFGPSQKVEPLSRPSSANHAVIELLLDAHRALSERDLLDRALELGRFWADRIHPETGLLPDLVDGAESFLDGNTDFAVVLRKLADLANDRELGRASDNLVAAVARWHRTPQGLARRTYVATGRVSDATVETRYTALYLKALLLPAGRSVWQSETLLSLLRDR